MNKIKGFLASSRAKKGIGSLLLTIIFTVAVIGLNFAATALQNAFPALSADLTANSMFRLSDETKNFLKQVNDEIRITALIDEEEFIANGTYFNQANSIARQFASYNPHITLRYMDYADNSAALENQYPDAELSDSSVFVVECTDKRYCVLDVTDIFNVSYDSTTYSAYIASSKVEQALATGILASTAEKLSKIAFISGLGDDSAYSALYDLLEQNAFSVTAVSLVTSDIPEDTDIAVIYAPSADLDSIVLPKIRSFLEIEGKTLIYISGPENIETPNIDALLEEYGLALGDGLMYDTSQDMIFYPADPPISTVNYGTEIFYEDIDDPDIPFISPNTRAVEVLSSAAKVMLYSSTEAVVLPFEYVGDSEGFDFEKAMTGTPVAAAAAGTNDISDIIVFGSSEAFDTTILGYNSFNNSGYFVNMCNSITERGDEFDVVINSKSMTSTVLNIKYQSTQNVLTVIFRWIVPALMLAAAAAVFIVRRKK